MKPSIQLDLRGARSALPDGVPPHAIPVVPRERRWLPHSPESVQSVGGAG